jgi:hypothetical protein
MHEKTGPGDSLREGHYWKTAAEVTTIVMRR